MCLGQEENYFTVKNKGNSTNIYIYVCGQYMPIILFDAIN